MIRGDPSAVRPLTFEVFRFLDGTAAMSPKQSRLACEIASKAEPLIDLACEADLPLLAILLGNAWRHAVRVAALGKKTRVTPVHAGKPALATLRTGESDHHPNPGQRRIRRKDPSQDS
jgi:hypothetical protein